MSITLSECRSCLKCMHSLSKYISLHMFADYSSVHIFGMHCVKLRSTVGVRQSCVEVV